MRNLKPRVLGPQIAVVLGGGLLAGGGPSEQTLLRGTAAAQLAAERPLMSVICSGDGRRDENRFHVPSEAHVLANLLWRGGVPPHRIWIEPDSRDTIGNAVLVAARFLQREHPRKLIIVTSPFHVQRALYAFRRVLAPQWQIEAYASAPAHDDGIRACRDDGGIGQYAPLLEGIPPGDLPAIAKRIQERWKPFYQTVPILTRLARKAA